MAREFAKKFYKSKAWLNCRQSYIEYRISVDGGYCEECQEELGKMVHHTILLTEGNINNPEISLNHEHLKYECKKCHDKEDEHFNKKRKKSSLTRKGIKFNENGELIKVE